MFGLARRGAEEASSVGSGELVAATRIEAIALRLKLRGASSAAALLIERGFEVKSLDFLRAVDFVGHYSAPPIFDSRSLADWLSAAFAVSASAAARFIVSCVPSA